MTLYTFDDFTFPPGVKISDNFANVVPRTQRLPGLSGGYDGYGIGPAPTEIGNVTISFDLFWRWAQVNYLGDNIGVPYFLEPEDAMLAARNAIRKLVMYGVKKLTKPVGNTGSRWCWARVNNITMRDNEDDHTRLRQPIQINFQVADPRWFTIGNENDVLWGDGTEWGDGTTWGGDLILSRACSGVSTEWTERTGLRDPLYYLTLQPESTAETYPRILVQVGSGGAENIYIQRLVGGAVVDSVCYLAPLVDGDQLEIDCRAHRVRLNGANAYNEYFDFETAEWLQLLPGNNSMRCLMLNAGDEADIYLRYYEAYR